MAGNENFQKLTECALPTGGVCRRDQLLANGLSDSTLDRLLASGAIQTICRGVYLVGVLRGPTTDLWSAVRAVPGAALARSTAGRIHGFVLPESPTVHVVTAKGAGRSLPGVTVHESRRLRSADMMTTKDALPITTPERTILDLAADVSSARLRHLVQLQVKKAWPDQEHLLACVRALSRPGVPGLLRLRRVLLESFDDEPFDGSELERLVWLGLGEVGLVGFRREYRPPWFDGIRGIVDFAHPATKVIIEADGRRWHAAEQAMADDRRRDRRAATSGWVVLRVSWHEVVHRPAAMFEEIAEVLERRTPRAHAA